MEKALEYKLGARVLRSIFESIMIDAMYDAPSSKKKTYEITLEFAKQQVEKNLR